VSPASTPYGQAGDRFQQAARVVRARIGEDLFHRAGFDDGSPARRIPGSVYVDLDTELAAAASPQEGRHPLPRIADLQASARRWGLRTDPGADGHDVVVLDDSGGLAAARPHCPSANASPRGHRAAAVLTLRRFSSIIIGAGSASS